MYTIEMYKGMRPCLARRSSQCRRPGLSMSLNQRASHDCPSRKLRWHQLMVLFGKRKSIGSIVRSFTLHPSQPIHGAEDTAGSPVSRFVKRATTLAVIPSAPCYLILCDGREVAVIVKDYITGTVRSTNGFIAQTNHDPGDDAEGTAQKHETTRRDRREAITSSFGIEGWVEGSVDRLECLQKKWDCLERKFRAKNSTASLRATPSITEKTLRKWISRLPDTQRVHSLHFHSRSGDGPNSMAHKGATGRL